MLTTDEIRKLRTELLAMRRRLLAIERQLKAAKEAFHMVYEVHVPTPDGSESRFEFKRDEPLKPGDLINPGTMMYKVIRILPDESDRYDAIVKAEWAGGPGQAAYVG